MAVFIIFLLLLAELPAQSNLGNLIGEIRLPTQAPMPGATVRLIGANRALLRETVSADDGRFRFDNLAAGQYEIAVTAFGFSNYHQIIDYPLPSADPLIITLQISPLTYEVITIASRGVLQSTTELPMTALRRNIDELLQRSNDVLPRMLAEEPGILVQQTTPGQGTPMLRGQPAQTILYLVDGVRYNNATYRSGNNQYLAWVPAAAVDSVEVLLGPAGSQYGSDGLGGALNVFTTTLPEFSPSRTKWGGEVRSWFESGDLSAGSSLLTRLATPRLTFLLDASLARHQDVRPGGGFDSRHVAARYLGLNPAQIRGVFGSRLHETAYTFNSWMTKFGIRLDDRQTLTFNWIQSNEYGNRRYDRLQGGNGWLRSDFKPQRLQFGYVSYQRLGNGRLASLNSTFSLNRQVDGHVEQADFQAPLNDDYNRSTVFGYQVSTTLSPIHGHRLSSGGEVYDEHVYSERRRTTASGRVQIVRPNLPNGARYTSTGLFVLDDWAVIPQRFLLNGGLRFSYFRYHSEASKNPIVNGLRTVPTSTQTVSDLTFHAGSSVFLHSNVVLFTRVARGFRPPTVFDLANQGLDTGGFEVSPADAARIGAQVTADKPFADLAPEKLWSFEGGLRVNGSRYQAEGRFFDTEFVDAIQRRTLLVNQPVVGQTVGSEPIVRQDAQGRIYVGIDSRPIVSRANIGHVRIQGVEGMFRASLSNQWQATVKGFLQKGREIDTGFYARGLAPANGFLSLRWIPSGKRFWLEVYSTMSRPQTRLNPFELTDARIGAVRDANAIRDFFNTNAKRLGLVEDGRVKLTGETLAQVQRRVLGPTLASNSLFYKVKGFATLNVRGGWSIGEHDEVLFGIQNITDTNYRVIGSGFDALGVNATVSYRRRF